MVPASPTANTLLPEVPTEFEFLESTADPMYAKSILAAREVLNAVGRVVVAPPGIPADRLQFLRGAFKQALHDPLLLEDAEKAGRSIVFATGEEMELVVRNVSLIPVEIRELFNRVARSEMQ